MTSKPTPDEKPKRTVARKVVAEKRRYFVPAHGAGNYASVEAADVDDAVKQAKKGAVSAEKEGDG